MKSKKSLLEKCTLTYDIAKLVDVDTLTGIRKQLGISKQRLDYHLNLLEEEGIVEHPHRGDYRLTQSSKKIIGRLIENENREKIRLEAMRYKFPITKGLDNLISEVNWSKVNQFNTTKEYHTEFEDHTARLIVPKKKQPSLELYCKKSYGYDIDELMFDAKLKVSLVMEHVSKKYGVEYEAGIQTMKPEFAIPSPLSEAVLSKMGASQVRTPEAMFNKSKGRGADIEPHDLQYAHRVIAMPDILDIILDEAKQHQRSLEVIQEQLGITTQYQMPEPRQVERDFRAYG